MRQLELVDQVERVASAMWTAGSPGFSWGIQPESVKYEYRRMAAAAIEAMQPSPALYPRGEK